jgi:hypothetical protein
MATWTDVSRLMKALPAIVRRPGRREWRVKDKLLAWERPLRRADRAALGASAPTGPILAVHAPLEAKEMLLESRPEVYFTTPHFDGWPSILVRLPAIPVEELRELLRQAWLERAPKKLVAALEGAKPLARRPRDTRPRRSRTALTAERSRAAPARAAT